MVVNVEVRADKDFEFERMMKKFARKVKKSGVLKEHVEKTLYFKTKSQKKREKKLRNRFLREKAQNASNYYQ